MKLRPLVAVLGLSLLFAGCGLGRGVSAPYAARDTASRDAPEVWRASEKSLPAARVVEGLEIRVESVPPIPGAEWRQGPEQGEYLPIVFRVTLLNRSDRAIEVAPSQTFLLDEQSRSLRLSGFRSVNGITSYFATTLHPRGRQVWEVGFRPGGRRRGALPQQATVVLILYGPSGRIAEPFMFERTR